MAVHLAFTDWSLVDSELRLELSSEPHGSHLVQDGTPVLLDDSLWPMEPWSSFLRTYGQSTSDNTLRAYGRDAHQFARYLDARGIRLQDVEHQILVDYRDHRFAQGISQRTWGRELVVIRALFNYVIQIGLRQDLPWIQVGRYSVANPRMTHQEMDVRALSKEQWEAFRRVGLGGELPDGSMDPAFRGRETGRDVTAAELALTTGMRLQEWSSLLTLELPERTDAGATVYLEATAKNQRRRAVYIPSGTMRIVDLYRATERAELIRRAQKGLVARRSELAVVESIDHGGGRLRYRVGGVVHKKVLERIPVGHRRVLVEDRDGVIEPLSLFLGRGGLPPSRRSWHAKFHSANRRLTGFREELPGMPTAVTPHDLRHTFAVVLLRSLQRRALEHESTRQKVGTGTISEHIMFNPLLTLQRLMGHASPSTTMVYLRYVDESHELIQRAFEQWDDPLLEYADYVLNGMGR